MALAARGASESCSYIVSDDPNARPRTGDFLTLVVDLGRGTGPRGLEMAAACPGADSQDLATILDPFRAIFVDLGPDRLSEI